MAELVVNATNSGHITFTGATGGAYATCHDAANGDARVNNSSWYIGNSLHPTANYYYIFRGGLVFDASGLPDDASISSAILEVYIPNTFQMAGGSDTLDIVSGLDLADTLVLADYGDLLDDTTSYGAVTIANGSQTGWQSITLNASGIAAISKTGITRFGVRLGKDISNTTPANLNMPYMDGSDAASTKPKITITFGSYFIPQVFIN